MKIRSDFHILANKKIAIFINHKTKTIIVTTKIKAKQRRRIDIPIKKLIGGSRIKHYLIGYTLINEDLIKE